MNGSNQDLHRENQTTVKGDGLEVGHHSLSEIVKVFLKLGFTAFGGPAAHIALMEEELVTKRQWIDRQKYLDIIGLTNLLPGPNSTEVAIMMGYLRGGIKGLFLAGASFIMPAMVMVTILASLYVRFGAFPQLAGIMYGIKPVIFAVILIALYKFFKTAVKDLSSGIFLIAAVALAFLNVNEILLLIGFGLAMPVFKRIQSGGTKEAGKLRSFSLPLAVWLSLSLESGVRMKVAELFLTFLKIGSVLYGSGYVLLAFIEREFVNARGVLTIKELMDSVAIGQFTPGPVFTTATFVGYLLGRLPGAIGATLGIFLPSFLLVWLLKPVLFKMRDSHLLRQVLDGVNLASLGLMAAVSITFGRNSIMDPVTGLGFLAAFALLQKTRINSAWLILAGAFLGFLTTVL